MCGIVGILDRSSDQLLETASSMLHKIAHRGPDAMGFWIDEGVALGNARLAIVDLSSVENQPMTINGKTLVFNGEIYNYKEVREELVSLGRRFKTNSDTEVVLQAFLQWELQSFGHLNGMWAIAIFDSISGSLVLSRDRLGVKPLYWTKSSERLAFSSEMKGLIDLVPTKTMNLTYFSKAISHNRADDGVSSPIAEISQVEAGSYLVVKSDLSTSSTKWWKIQKSTEITNEDSAHSLFRDTFQDAVRIRIPTDVRYGFSLSGGLDSTAVFSCAGLNDFFGSKPSGAFNLTYSDGSMDESSIALETAALFKQHLAVMRVNPELLFQNIADVVWSQEGIGWNPSILAYDYYYSRLQDFGIKVILEGHGADEMFGGYPGMTNEYLIQKKIHQSPRETLEMLKMVDRSGNPEVGEFSTTSNHRILANFVRAYAGSNNVFRMGKTDNKSKLFSNELTSAFSNPAEENPFQKNSFKSVSYRHTIHQTLPQVLRVFDRASMAHGIESRAPFLDYRLFELSMKFSDSILLSHKYTKPLVREALASFIPSRIANDKIKKGFGAPLQKIMNSKETRSFLLSEGMQTLFRDTEFLDSTKLISLLKSKQPNFSRNEILEIWQATTFSIWRSKFL